MVAVKVFHRSLAGRVNFDESERWPKEEIARYVTDTHGKGSFPSPADSRYVCLFAELDGLRSAMTFSAPTHGMPRLAGAFDRGR